MLIYKIEQMKKDTGIFSDNELTANKNRHLV